MKLLHICSLSNNKMSGIDNVVPNHYIFQKKHANVFLLNCNKIKIKNFENDKNVLNLNDYNNDINNVINKIGNPDLVVFHGIYMPQYLKIYKKLVKYNIKYIIIPHGSLTNDAQKIKPLKKIIGNLLLFNNFINNSLAIQYLSESEKEMSYKFKKNGFILGNGMSTPNKIKKNFSKKGIKIIYVGRYDIYHKGIDIIIDYSHKYKDFLIDNNIEINLYGAGNDGKENVKKLVNNKKIENIIKVNGPIFDENKIEKILNNDVFIQFSRLEGQPLGIMEALYLGMPVLVTPGTTFGNIVENNKCGFLCKNAEDYLNALKKIINDKKYLNYISNNAFEYANINFAWEEIAKKTISKYKLIIKDIHK